MKVVRADDDVILEVRNRGPVIAREVVPPPFERFRRGADAAASIGVPRPGWGLGLHIVEQIAEEHGGTISARPSADQGTVFMLSLPADDPGPASELPRGSRAPRSRSVEDEWGRSESLDPDNVGDIADEGAGHRG